MMKITYSDNNCDNNDIFQYTGPRISKNNQILKSKFIKQMRVSSAVCKATTALQTILVSYNDACTCQIHLHSTTKPIGFNYDFK